MKIKTIDHYSGTFKNYLGIEQHFDIAIVSYIPDGGSNAIISNAKCYVTIPKIVMGIGTAFCRAKSATSSGDEYNPEIGKKIAIAHATSEKAFCTITQDQMGFIDAPIRKAMLDNLVKNVKEEPERFSISYKKAKEDFEKSRESEKVWSELSHDEQTCVNIIAQSSDETIDKINYLLENYN